MRRDSSYGRFRPPWTSPAYASPPPPPDTCTSAARAPRSSTGCGRGGTGGTFILRIEDTDQERSTKEAEAAIFDGLRWLGLDWDEGPEVGGPHGPYFQMERLDLYEAHAEKLIAEGKAYACSCTKEELDAGRKKAEAEKRQYRYPGTCRDKAHDRSKPHVVRFRVPEHGATGWDDLVKGHISTPHETLQDEVILRSDRVPLYNFGAVVDDITMKVNLVGRGDDHVNNTARQILMYRALGYPVPAFAHFPMILGADKTRLSKRHGATSVTAYRDMGYLPAGGRELPRPPRLVARRPGDLLARGARPALRPEGRGPDRGRLQPGEDGLGEPRVAEEAPRRGARAARPALLPRRRPPRRGRREAPPRVRRRARARRRRSATTRSSSATSTRRPTLDPKAKDKFLTKDTTADPRGDPRRASPRFPRSTPRRSRSSSRPRRRSAASASARSPSPCASRSPAAPPRRACTTSCRSSGRTRRSGGSTRRSGSRAERPAPTRCAHPGAAPTSDVSPHPACTRARILGEEPLARGLRVACPCGLREVHTCDGSSWLSCSWDLRCPASAVRRSSMEARAPSPTRCCKEARSRASRGRPAPSSRWRTSPARARG